MNREIEEIKKTLQKALSDINALEKKEINQDKIQAIWEFFSTLTTQFQIFGLGDEPVILLDKVHYNHLVTLVGGRFDHMGQRKMVCYCGSGTITFGVKS